LVFVTTLYQFEIYFYEGARFLEKCIIHRSSALFAFLWAHFSLGYLLGLKNLTVLLRS
jgi:hypothetical protein